MDEAYYRTMLFDFYGELLTDKQREYFDLHYNEDLSLSEIAESRAGGHIPAGRLGYHSPGRGRAAPV